MAQKEYSTKGKKFQHLTIEKRAQIEILLRMKVPKIQIAQMVGIARSTLYNELARGSVVQLDSELRQYTRYFSDVGQRVYEEHRENSRPPLKLAKAHEFVAYAEQQILSEKLGPETICGMVRRNGMFQEIVCAKTLYNYIDQCLLKVRNIDLLLKVKRKQSTHRDRQHKHLFGMSIEERPDAVNKREEFGHWEIDTVVGNKGLRFFNSCVLSDCFRKGNRHVIMRLALLDVLRHGIRGAFDLSCYGGVCTQLIVQ